MKLSGYKAQFFYTIMQITILALPHGLASFGMSRIYGLIRTPSEHEYILNVLQQSGYIPMFIAFAVPTFLIISYSHKIIVAIGRDDAENAATSVKVRLLNLPAVGALLGLSGWALMIAAYFLNSWLYSIPLLIKPALRCIIDMTLAGSFVFVLTFYLVEAFVRKFYMKIFFPDKKLSDFKNVFTPSIRGRFRIYYFAVCIFPLFLFYSIFLSSHNDKLNQITVLTIVIIILSTILTILITRLYRVPLLAMKDATGRILHNNYELDIDVVSTDELGNLGEAFNEMARGLKDKELLKETFGKVVDPRIRDHLLNGNIELGGEVQQGVILFSDIRNFTATVEKIEPETTVRWLNSYFDRMSAAIESEGGIVNKFIGDSIMAIFGIPVKEENPEISAVKAAVKMRNAEGKLNREYESQGLPQIKSGIGIHAGPVLAGNIGSSTRMEYTVIGDAVNIASRIEQSCKELSCPLLFSDEIAGKVKNIYDVRSKGSTTLKGKSEAIELFTIESI